MTAPTLQRPALALYEDPTRPASLTMREVTKRYDRAHTALDRVSLQVGRGSFLAVLGPPGAGKSTLLHCAAGLEDPTSGEVRIGGTALAGLSEERRTSLRRGRLGFVFESYNLLPSLTIEENLSLPLRLTGTPTDPRWMDRLVERAGLTGLLKRRPGELTRGEGQRAAICRAMAGRPEVVFADEPSGALESGEAEVVLDLLREVVDDFGQTLVMVTGDREAASRAHMVAMLDGGRIEGLETGPGAVGPARPLERLRG